MFELGRYLARGHDLHLFRVDLLPRSPFDLDGYAREVFVYRYRGASAFQRRVEHGRWFPEAFTFFEPLERTHQQIALDINAGGYNVALVHPDAFTQSPYLLRWLRGVPGVYYCQEPLRVVRERSLFEEQRQLLLDGGLPRIRRLDRRLALRRRAAADFRNVRCANVVLANSYFSREQIWAAYARDAIVCYLGVDPELFSPGTQERRNELLAVGPATQSKAHDLVIEALARVAPARRPRLRIVAPVASDVEWIRDLARNLGVELVIEQGITEADLVERYQSALATVCAARLEPFGLSALESMACATPVIAVKEGGLRESVLAGETGLLVDRDAGAMATAISALTGDPMQAQAMGRRGHDEVCRRWTWELSGRRLESILYETAG
jgi:glycosyltransferase involved in cell wall biosynthesis